MTELDAVLIRRKLERIATNLEDLAAVEDLSLEAYRSDRFRRKGIERMLQETVEAAVDANSHLLRASGDEPPADYYESFTRLGRASRRLRTSRIAPKRVAASHPPGEV